MRKYKDALVGVAKCPKTNKLYGVTIEVLGKKWRAFWAFPIKPEVAKREGYLQNQFPPDLEYDKEYPGCPYCHKFEDLAVISKPVQQKTERKKNYVFSVTEPSFDDIGAILSSLKLKYQPYYKIRLKCDIVFINCGTNDDIDPKQLREYVYKGGCVYASDWGNEVIQSAFPEIFNFRGRVGNEMKTKAVVTDPELRKIVGDYIQIEFDLGAWAVLDSVHGADILLSGAPGTQIARLPVMVKAKYGKGTVFYTCFHNYSQASEQETALLQLLVLKQIATGSGESIEDASKDVGVDIDAIKAKFKRNW